LGLLADFRAFGGSIVGAGVVLPTWGLVLALGGSGALCPGSSCHVVILSEILGG